MLSRVVKPDQTTYGFDYQRKNVRKEIGRNLSTQVTTGVHYSNTPKTLYGSDIKVQQNLISNHQRKHQIIANTLEHLAN